MDSSTTQTTTDEYVYIDLDERNQWWIPIAIVIAATLVIAVLVAPWAIDLDSNQSDAPGNTTVQANSTICRPDSTGVPALFDPTLDSWSRLCEWFIAP